MEGGVGEGGVVGVLGVVGCVFGVCVVFGLDDGVDFFWFVFFVYVGGEVVSFVVRRVVYVRVYDELVWCYCLFFMVCFCLWFCFWVIGIFWVEVCVVLCSGCLVCGCSLVWVFGVGCGFVC